MEIFVASGILWKYCSTNILCERPDVSSIYPKNSLPKRIFCSLKTEYICGCRNQVILSLTEKRSCQIKTIFLIINTCAVCGKEQEKMNVVE